jgi:hypothetical protein
MITIETLVKTLNKKPTKKEIISIETIYKKIKILSDLYITMRDAYSDTTPENNSIEYRSKPNGEYGHYINNHTKELYLILSRLKITKMLDLGSGPGIIFKPLATELGIANHSFIGYENETELVEIGQKYGNNIKQKDILKLTAEDFKDIPLVYFWEPMNDRKLCEQFVNNLELVIPSNVIVVYRFSGYIREFLDVSKRFKEAVHKQDYYYKIYLTT